MKERICRTCKKRKDCYELKEIGTDELVGFECKECTNKEEDKYQGMEQQEVLKVCEKGPHGLSIYGE